MTGINITQWMYSLDASITSRSPLRSVMIHSPQKKYASVNMSATPVPQYNRALTLWLILNLSFAPRQLPHSDSPANAKPSIKYENSMKNCISRVFTARTIVPCWDPALVNHTVTAIRQQVRKNISALTEKNRFRALFCNTLSNVGNFGRYCR